MRPGIGNNQAMYSKAIGIRMGLTVLGMAAVIGLVGHLPGVPYNLRELVADSNPLVQSFMLSGALYALFALPASIVILARRSTRAIWTLPFLLTAATAVLWIFLRKGAPTESIHDILGSPTLNLAWEWEYLFRLSGIVYGLGTMISGASLLASAYVDRPVQHRPRQLITWFLVAVPMVALSHWIVIDQAATDNLTELMAAGGRWYATVFICLWAMVIGFAGSTVSTRLVFRRPSRQSASLIIIASVPVAWLALWLGLEGHVHKYHDVFSALQFLLSTDREHLAEGPDLLARYLVFHCAMVVLVAIFQYPIWASMGVYKPRCNSNRIQPDRKSTQRLPGSLAFPLAYGGLLVYGTLFPLDAFQTSGEHSLLSVLTEWPGHVSLGDVFINAVVYMPFGFLTVIVLRTMCNRMTSLSLASTAGLLLSWMLEYLQYSIPERNTSNLDLALNVCGTFLGAVTAIAIDPRHSLGSRLLALRNNFFHQGHPANVGLAAVGLWFLAATIPFVPSLDLGNLRHSVAPLWATLRDPSLFSLLLLSAYTLSFFAMGQLVMLAGLSSSRSRIYFIGLMVASVFLSIPIVTRSLDPEALLSLMLAIFMLYAIGTNKSRPGALLGSVAIVTAYIARNLYVPVGAADSPGGVFNWVPFSGQMENVQAGFADVLDNTWPFVALAYLVWLHLGGRFRHSPVIGAILVFALVFVLNIAQLVLPGRYPDITDALVATAAWSLAWTFMRVRKRELAIFQHRGASAVTPAQPSLQRSVGLLPTAAVLLFSLPLASLLLETLFAGTSPQVVPAQELMAPDDLPPAPLTYFHFGHPRLPAPSVAEIAMLQSRNPSYFRQLERMAQGERSNLDSAVTLAYAQPGTRNLDDLFKQLLALNFIKRAGGEVKPVVKAYDWLYPRWSPVQREQLRAKVADGCDQLIGYIRKEQLSPYNVILYNSLLQDLVACAISVYGDDSRGGPIMAFTYDLLKKRVLPVWRQVMGKNGGWHEGAEYVGIGIGQAIYRVPAMWRKATGEDLFHTEPGIRGFLDFLVYRTRPDGTDFRWGDGAYFDRRVPDRIPLAIEYRDAAAYSLNGCPAHLQPTSWPWGPLTDDTLCDPNAVSRLPLARYFDGIGMIVARSDWTPDATYVSFKAGDNFWSHTHLDQGAFTIYKGGALAIDSGFYGGGHGYGSEHHMNYSYQTIAHNTITVIDPADTVPMPRKDKPPRHIANDGGQRRVGSGWGINAAPLDLEEWQRNREIYHTGTMQKVFVDDDLVIAVADLTPAYTNSLSGAGTFSHRTRRVEAFTRTFAYDRLNDLVLVFDRVRSTRPEFLKRWLHHTLLEPTITTNGYTVQTLHKNRTGHEGGSLAAYVVLPRKPIIKAVGGKGYEFYVDGKNYDEGGLTLQKADRSKTAEPGRWRIELQPATESAESLFLVVLHPSTGVGAPEPLVKPLQQGARTGCEIIGPRRTTYWWFSPDRNGTIVELHDDRGTRIHDVTVPATVPD